MDEKKIRGFIGHQHDRKVISGVINVIDLIEIYEIDVWSPGKSIEEQGCQRPPIQSHYRKIGRKLKDQKISLPTSIILSANDNKGKNRNKNSIEIHPINNHGEVEIVIKKGHKLRVVDGQHRILGLQYAINDLKQADLKSFQIPFVIMLVNDRVDEISLFYEINSTPKRVSTDLALQLLNEMKQNKDLKISKTEKWKLVGLNVAMNLSDRKDSVWYQNISIGQANNDAIASSTSFVTSLKPMLEISFIKSIWENSDDEKSSGKRIADLVDTYWNALRMVMPKAFPVSQDEKELWVIQKTPGFFAWHMVGAFVIDEYLIKRNKERNITEQVIADFITKYAETGFKAYEGFWRASNRELGFAGGEASRANSQKAFKELAENIKDDIEDNYFEEEESQINF